ncbi:MAG: PAS domain S-box protein [Bacteroidota bacterium]
MKSRRSSHRTPPSKERAIAPQSVRENVFREVFDNSSDALAVIEPRGLLIAANSAACRILGFKMTDVGKKAITTALKEPDALALIRKAARNGRGEVQCVLRNKPRVSIRIRPRSVGSRYVILSLTPDSTTRIQRTSKASSFLSQFIAADTPDSEGYYQSIVQHSPYGVGIVFGGKLVMANPIFARILGYRASEELEGKEISGFIDSASRRFFTLLSSRKVKGESVPARFETQMLRADGSLIDVEASFTLGSYRGELALNVTISDITLRKELEKRLTDSERLFRNVVNSMVDALVVTDLEGKVLDVNEEFERLTGFSRREALNAMIPYPWIDEEDLRMYISWLDGLRVKSESRDFDLTWVSKGGKRIAVSLNTTLLHNASGAPMLMVNIARDISERKAAQEELGRQLNRLEVLYDLGKALGGTLDPVEIARITFEQLKKVIPTEAFYIDLYDEPARQVRSLIAVDIINEKQLELKVRDDRIPLHERMANWRVVQSRRPILELRKSIPARPPVVPFGDEGRASASLMYAPMFSKDRIIGIISAQSYDISAYTDDHLTLLENIANLAAIAIEKANLHQEALEKSREVEARNKELDDFTYVVSHDLKEPLISVEGYAKIIKEEYSGRFDPAAKEYLKSILDSCGHMKGLIEDLLQLSRVGKLAEQKQRLNLHEVIKDVLEELQFTIRERKAEISVDGELPEVFGVDQHLKIVFRNLLSNGIKFCDKLVPQIRITAAIKGNIVEIAVKDNGIGIPEEFHEKIFMIFQRLHKKEEYEGTGAGLTIVRKIIEAHGGTIRLSSVPGTGTTFFFTLPFADKKEPARA